MENAVIAAIVRYFDAIIAVLRANDNTAAGTTDGKRQSLAHLETDGAKLADAVFPPGVIRIPAEQFALGEGYDATQACTRLSRIYAATRPDYYQLARESTKVRINRLEFRKALLVGLINVSRTPRRAQYGG